MNGFDIMQPMQKETGVSRREVLQNIPTIILAGLAGGSIINALRVREADNTAKAIKVIKNELANTSNQSLSVTQEEKLKHSQQIRDEFDNNIDSAIGSTYLAFFTNLVKYLYSGRVKR